MRKELTQIRRRLFYLPDRDASANQVISLTARATEILKRYRKSLQQQAFPTNLDLTISQLEANLSEMEHYRELHGPRRKEHFLHSHRQNVWSDLSAYLNSNQQVSF